MTDRPIDLGRPTSGDVIELILADHVRFEGLLRQLRDDSTDRDAVRRAFADLHVAHASVEERLVYPRLRATGALGEHEAEHGEEEHAEGNEALLAVLELDQTEGEAFDEAVERLSKLVNHHLAEEELSILNPARRDVPADVRDELGRVFASERNALIEAGCGRVERVRTLVRAAADAGLLDDREGGD
jgi:hemerythrin-like domain-containing protein